MPSKSVVWLDTNKIRLFHKERRIERSEKLEQKFNNFLYKKK